MDKKEIDPFKLSLDLGVSWRHAKLKDGYYFCTCDNPLHQGCSIAIQISKELCEWCKEGCQTHKKDFNPEGLQ